MIESPCQAITAPEGFRLYQEPMLGMLVHGSAGGSAPGLQQLDGDAVRRADEGHAAVTRRAVDRYAAGDEGVAGVADVVYGVGEMPEISAASVRLGIPVVSEIQG